MIKWLDTFLIFFIKTYFHKLLLFGKMNIVVEALKMGMSNQDERPSSHPGDFGDFLLQFLSLCFPRLNIVTVLRNL